MSGFDLHPEAFADVDEIWEYIAIDSVDAADRMTAEIFAAIHKRVDAPHSGHRRLDLTNRRVRFVRVYDYLIAYAPDEKPLWVLAVLHGKRDPRMLAAILRSRYEV